MQNDDIRVIYWLNSSTCQRWGVGTLMEINNREAMFFINRFDRWSTLRFRRINGNGVSNLLQIIEFKILDIFPGSATYSRYAGIVPLIGKLNLSHSLFKELSPSSHGQSMSSANLRGIKAILSFKMFSLFLSSILLN